MNVIKKSSLLLLFIMPLFSFGQQESYYSLYRYNMNVINPAFAGADASNMLSLLQEVSGPLCKMPLEL